MAQWVNPSVDSETQSAAAYEAPSMQSKTVFDKSNRDWIHTEAAAWLTVMKELRSFTSGLDANRQSDARRLLGAAENALHHCTTERASVTDQLVDEARRSVEVVLTLFSQHAEFVRDIHFLSAATLRLDRLVDSAEALKVKSLPESERIRICKALGAVADTFAAKLNDWEKQLDESDLRGSETSHDS